VTVIPSRKLLFDNSNKTVRTFWKNTAWLLRRFCSTVLTVNSVFVCEISLVWTIILSAHSFRTSYKNSHTSHYHHCHHCHHWSPLSPPLSPLPVTTALSPLSSLSPCHCRHLSHCHHCHHGRHSHHSVTTPLSPLHHCHHCTRRWSPLYHCYTHIPTNSALSHHPPCGPFGRCITRTKWDS
jgi:hypothetical protein